MNGRYAKGTSGAISVRALFWLTVLAIGIYLAYMLVPPYAGYYMLKTEVQGEAKTAHMYSDAALKRRITQKAAAWSVQLDDQTLEIVRGREDISIAVNYTVDLEFLNGYERQLVFTIDVQEPLKETGRILQ